MKEHILSELRCSIDKESWAHGYQWIYGVQMAIPGHTNLPIKIGIAANVAIRVASLQTGQPYPLQLLAYFPAIRGRDTEDLIHRLFAEFRLCGEWFRCDEAILVFLQEQRTAFEQALEFTKPLHRRRAREQAADIERRNQLAAWNHVAGQGLTTKSIQVAPPLTPPEPVLVIKNPHVRQAWIDRVNNYWRALPQEQRLISPDEAAVILGVEEKILTALCRRNDLACVRLGARTYRFTAELVLDAIESLQILPPTDIIPSGNVRA